MLSLHEKFMWRCLQLAESGAGYVAPNPMVGAVLVYNNRIIGEGYHKKYGEAHAEVNCIQSVKQADAHLINEAVLYVSLEPCNHFGKTPPCTDLIIRNKISKVVIGCPDNNAVVNGKGIEKLRNNKVKIIVGVLEKHCKELNKRFFNYHLKQRPYIVLKWAQTADNKIAGTDNKRLLISNDCTNKLVHKWRSQEAAILIGTNTALKDNPILSNRLWTGKSPVRLVIDLNLKLSNELNIFNDDAATIVFNYQKQDCELFELFQNRVYYVQLEKNISIIQQILNACYQLNILSILVEGGRKTLQSFIDENLWDEAKIITNKKIFAGEGLKAPEIKNTFLLCEQIIHTDMILTYNNISYN